MLPSRIKPMTSKLKKKFSLTSETSPCRKRKKETCMQRIISPELWIHPMLKELMSSHIMDRKANTLMLTRLLLATCQVMSSTVLLKPTSVSRFVMRLSQLSLLTLWMLCHRGSVKERVHSSSKMSPCRRVETWVVQSFIARSMMELLPGQVVAADLVDQ